MKVRNSFVSNSSSCSYTIQPGKDDFCEHCGRRGPNFEKLMDILWNANEWSESGIQYENKEQLLDDIQHQIDIRKEDIEKYSSLDINDIHPDDKRRLKWAQETLEEEQERFYKINALEGEVVGIRVGYHDETTKDAFNEAKKYGTIIIVEDWM